MKELEKWLEERMSQMDDAMAILPNDNPGYRDAASMQTAYQIVLDKIKKTNFVCKQNQSDKK